MGVFHIMYGLIRFQLLVQIGKSLFVVGLGHAGMCSMKTLVAVLVIGGAGVNMTVKDLVAF